jgi:hypothetical protein
MNKPEWIVSPITADDLGAVHNIEQQPPSPGPSASWRGIFLPQPACSLYEKFDFLVTGSRKNYYSDPNDDAVCMSLNIQTERHQ